MRIQLKLLIYFMIVLNVCSLFMNITKVSAREVGIVQDFTQSENFDYDIDIPLVNGSNANRIAVENFEYDTNTNLSKTERYSTYNRFSNPFSLVVKDFNDIDFDMTNNTYLSKKCEITTTKASQNYYLFDYNITNDYRFGSVMASAIIQPIDMTDFTFMMYYGLEEYFYVQYELHSGDLVIGDESSIYATYTDFFPLKTAYDYIYMGFSPLYVFINHTVQFHAICYNQTGQIICHNDTLKDLESIRNYKLTCLSYYCQFASSIGKKTSIIALDNNCICDRRINPQLAISSYFMNLKYFYLTKVPFYTDYLVEASEGYRYGTTLYKGRYLRYLTNASYNYNEEYNFSGNFENSFSFQIGFALNDTLSLFEFHSTYFYFGDISVILDYYDNFVSIYYYNGLTLLRKSDYAFEGFFDNFSVVSAQFKNNLFSLTFLYNFTIINEQFIITSKFDNLILFGYITNFDIKPLNVTTMINYANNTLVSRSTDNLSFQNKVSIISTYFTFFNTITINSLSISDITINDVIYELKSQSIIAININSTRNEPIGSFTVSDDNELYNSLFNGSELTNSKIYYDLLYGKSSGNIILKAEFYQIFQAQITLTIVLHITRFMVFTNQIPENNLLIAKIIEILLPIMIFFLIVIGFKSNSDSKYLPIIGMYIGIFTLYLMEYMSLLFMILCFLFQTIGLYIIIKKEKMEGI